MLECKSSFKKSSRECYYESTTYQAFSRLESRSVGNMWVVDWLAVVGMSTVEHDLGGVKWGSAPLCHLHFYPFKTSPSSFSRRHDNTYPLLFIDRTDDDHDHQPCRPAPSSISKPFDR